MSYLYSAKNLRSPKRSESIKDEWVVIVVVNELGRVGRRFWIGDYRQYRRYRALLKHVVSICVRNIWKFRLRKSQG